MNLPNEHFRDFPIEFKEINPEDFPNYIIENNGEKVLIEPNDEGFINNALQAQIDINSKNTVVVNAAVGQGKSYSIIEIIKKYYDSADNYLIFVAAPFVSLVEQYFDKIQDKGIPENQIYRYEYIGNDSSKDAWNSKIQIVTVNTLLGNPGEDAFINSKEKRKYLDYLVEKCERNDRKVVFIFDEIHDAIHNFKEEYIFNLWKWRNILQKNILLSATYNEASKVVIEYLAELTDNKIKIIESKRVRFPEKQSDLYLHFNPSRYYTHDNDGIVQLVDSLIQKGKNIDILSFSKRLADDISQNTSEGVGALLIEAYDEIQNCTSDLDDNARPYRKTPKNRFHPEKCNVGTNFKTGVSIEKENHAYIIIMPPKRKKNSFKPIKSIFIGGINSIIQAIARQRLELGMNGEIHIILPPPDKFNFDSLNFNNENQKQVFTDYYLECQDSKSSERDKVKYLPLKVQHDLLLDYYENTLYDNIKNEDEYVKTLTRTNELRLEYPSFKLFKLGKGEAYLPYEYKFFGKDLSSYITYCAITNQFINCDFKGANTKSVIFFKKGEIQWKLEDYYSNYMDEGIYNSLYDYITDMYKYFEFKHSIFNQYKVMYNPSDGTERKEILSFSKKNFETQILAFLQRKFYPRNKEFNSRFNKNGYYVDAEYTRGDYFRACISHALSMNIEEIETESLRNRVRAFLNLEYFRNKLIESKIRTSTRKRGELFFLWKTPTEEFISIEEQSKFEFLISELTENDYFLKNNIFNWKKIFNSEYNNEQKKASFYRILVNDFFDSESYKIRSGIHYNKNVKIIKHIHEPLQSELVLDLVKPMDVTTEFKEHFSDLGGWDAYNDEINRKLE